MGFKSRRYPINEVRSIMKGKDCLLFTEKKKRTPPAVADVEN
ncbi:MAG: hypothetical protein PVI71_16335 [Desulfobacterales bacterium]